MVNLLIFERGRKNQWSRQDRRDKDKETAGKEKLSQYTVLILPKSLHFINCLKYRGSKIYFCETNLKIQIWLNYTVSLQQRKKLELKNVKQKIRSFQNRMNLIFIFFTD